MTTDALSADLTPQPAWTASPPQSCLNGCTTRQGGEMTPTSCESGQLLCPGCGKRLDKWLRGIPDDYALLPSVVEHGTVPADPGTKHTKRPDPPAPMRLEVIDLLDIRPGYGVLAIVRSWTELVRDQRYDTRPCQCGHALPGHTGKCSAQGCGCQTYRPVEPTVSRECAYLITNLPWAAGNEWIVDLYDEIRVLARTLADTVGEYRPKPVGRCAALIDLPDTGTAYSIQQGVCGGALVMDREGAGVHCLRCPSKYEATLELRQLGLVVESMFRTNQQEAS